jgi:excisionase family DNA binding protein
MKSASTQPSGARPMTETLSEEPTSDHRVEQRRDQEDSESPVTDGEVQHLFGVDAASRYLGVSRATEERLAHRGDLPVIKVGGSTLYDVRDLEQYIEINRRRAPLVRVSARGRGTTESLAAGGCGLQQPRGLPLPMRTE